MSKESTIYSADLRHGLIPCGDCGFEEEMGNVEQEQRDEIRRLTALLSNYQEQTSSAITQLTTSMKYIQEGIDYQRSFAERMDSRQDALERKIDQYNNLRERTDLLEKAERERKNEFVPRPEFNGAFRSVKGQISTMQWIFGIGFAATSGIVTGVIILMLGG